MLYIVLDTQKVQGNFVLFALKPENCTRQVVMMLIQNGQGMAEMRIQCKTMKEWIEKKIKEHNANNVIIFPLREEDVERRLRNIQIDKELEEKNEEVDDAGKRK